MDKSGTAAYELQQLEEQARHINKDTWLCVVEDGMTKRVGNMMRPECLWIDFELGVDNLEVLRGLPHVAIFPRSEESARRWTKLNVGKVASIIRTPTQLVDACLLQV